jgi:hypothetical protein
MCDMNSGGVSRLCSLAMLVAVILTGAVGPAAAQGSAPTGPGLETAFIVTRDVTGSVVTVDLESTSVVVADEKGRTYTFTLGKEARFRADRRSPFEGRKDLGVANLAQGQRVRVTYRGTDAVVTEVRWLRPR